jgi:alpha-glucosidase
MYLSAQSDEERQQLTKVGEELFAKQVEYPEVHDLMKELRQVVNEFPEKVLVGENDDVSYYGNGSDELHLVFNFPLMRTDRLSAEWVRTNQKERLSTIPEGGWPCNTLGNHDGSRVWSAFGDGKHDGELARLSLALVLTLQGTPFLYNGEEVGMVDTLLEDPALLRDNMAVFAFQSMINFAGMTVDEAMKNAAKVSRDRCRTPVQWNASPNAGFSLPGISTWLPVNPNHLQGVNVADQLLDPNSLLNFYKHLLHLRRNTPALVHGDYQSLGEHTDCLLFVRTSQVTGQSCLVVLNMSESSHELEVDGFSEKPSQVKKLFSSHSRPDEMEDPAHLVVSPYEIFIGEIFSKH